MFNEIYSPNSKRHVVKKGDTLWMLSQTYDVSVQSIIAANPSVNSSNLQIGSTLYIPEASSPPTLPHACPDSTFPYIVQAGDTLWMLSHTYNVSVQSILDLNPGINPQNLQIGSTLCIPIHLSQPTPPKPSMPSMPSMPPAPRTPPSQSVTCPNGAFPYIVQTGDTLWMLSHTYNVSVQSILDLNPGINPQNLQIGSTLCIPVQLSQPTPPKPSIPQKPPAPRTSPSQSVTCPNGAFPYIVQTGDTLWMLSHTYNVSVQSILNLNPGINPQNLQIGSTLCIPIHLSQPTPPKPSMPSMPSMPPAPRTPPSQSVTCPNGAFPYIVQAGDTLWMLSHAYNVSVQSILNLNPGINPQNLQIGSTLCIPVHLSQPTPPKPSMPSMPSIPPVPSTSSSPSVFPYLIKNCDSICKIARKFYVSVESILQKNPGINPKCLQAGTYIYVPINCCKESTCRYTVRKCDTLNSIANKFNVCPLDLIEANPNINFQHLVRCQIICIPNTRMY